MNAIEARTDEIEAVDILEASDLDAAGTLRLPAIGDLVDDTLARANVTQEVRIEDILESNDAMRVLSWETPPDAFYHPGGRVRMMGEVTIERAPPPEPTIVGRLRERRRRFGVLVAAVLVVPLGILAGAAIVTVVTPAPTPVVAALPPQPPPPVVTATSAPPPPPPSPVVESKPTSGTLIGPPKKAILLDGKKLGTSTAIVACGKHVVKVGWGKPQTVDVPCGGELRVK